MKLSMTVYLQLQRLDLGYVLGNRLPLWIRAAVHFLQKGFGKSVGKIQQGGCPDKRSALLFSGTKSTQTLYISQPAAQATICSAST